VHCTISFAVNTMIIMNKAFHRVALMFTFSAFLIMTLDA
jgi:hypothetical protein